MEMKPKTATVQCAQYQIAKYSGFSIACTGSRNTSNHQLAIPQATMASTLQSPPTLPQRRPAVNSLSVQTADQKTAGRTLNPPHAARWGISSTKLATTRHTHTRVAVD
jgi:hypothetical protein